MRRRGRHDCGIQVFTGAVDQRHRLTKECDFDLCEIDGGNKRNAIAREAFAIINIDRKDLDKADSIFETTVAQVRDEFSASDPDINGSKEECGHAGNAIDSDSAKRLILALNSALHGVLEMNASIPGLVETSTNLAFIKMTEGNIVRIGTNQRSSTDSSRQYAAERVESLFILAGANVEHSSEYPGWKPNIHSPILEASIASYERLFNVKPVVRAIHAGLECGLFLDKYPDLDMISFGPTIRGVHAPGEKLDLASLDKFAKLLADIIENYK